MPSRRHKHNKTHDYLEEMVCPITHELPLNPVVAEDGRVYESKAWLQYVKLKKGNGRIKSPWTQKKISKKAHSSTAIKQVIENAVRNKHVRKEMCTAWNESFLKEEELLKLKSDAKKDPDLFMKLGDWYSNGTDGVSKDLETAFSYYEKGWTHTSNKSFFLRMMMLNTLRPQRTRTSVICAWSSICQMIDDYRAAFVVKNTLCKLPLSDRINVAKWTNVEAILSRTDFDRAAHCANDCIPDQCAVEMASFLEQNAKDFYSDNSEEDDSSEDDDSENEDENEDDNSEDEDEENEGEEDEDDELSH